MCSEADSFEDFTFVRDLIGQTQNIVHDYLQCHPDASAEPANSTMVHSDGRVPRWPSNITNIVEPSPRRVTAPRDNSDPRTRLQQPPPRRSQVNESLHQVSDTDSNSTSPMGSEQTVMYGVRLASPPRGQNDRARAYSRGSNRQTGNGGIFPNGIGRSSPPNRSRGRASGRGNQHQQDNFS